jgi:hypothetical protein
MKFLDNMGIVCLKCNVETILPFEIEYNYFICPSCFTSHQRDNEGLIIVESSTKPTKNPVLQIGKVVILSDTEYCVFNFIEKRTESGEYWCEYELKSKENLSIYITDEGGNWILEQEIESKKVSGSGFKYYDDIEFSLFEKGIVNQQIGCGFFSYKLNKKNIEYLDYINPPYVLSFECEKGESEKIFLGEHINRNEISKIFEVKGLPSKSYIGSAQPFYYDTTDVIKIFLAFIILTLLIHLANYSNSKNELILEKEINLSESYTTDILSLRGAIAPLTINISSDVDNSWVATDFSLVNVTTGETAYFSKDVEYYYGYSEGENWTEGSKDEEFSICGVSAGDYRIVINPTRDETNIINNYLKISVYWDKKNNWNFMFVILAFTIFTIILFIIKNSFESNRWGDSPYSPYLKDEN